MDSYSAFWDNGNLVQTDLYLKLLKRGVTDVYVGGLAYDVCVRYTAEDSAQFGFNTSVIRDACRGVDLATIADTEQLFQKIGVKLVQSSHILN